MFRIVLPADRAEPDMAAVAKAFGIGVDALMNDLRTGRISRWFERGEGDDDNKPHQVFASAELGIRVDVDEYGDVLAAREYGTMSAGLRPQETECDDAGRGHDTTEPPRHPGSTGNPGLARNVRLDALLDEALDQSFPASDPIAICVEWPERTVPSPRTSGGGERHA